MKTIIENLISNALDPKNAAKITLEMPSHDAVFEEIAEDLASEK